MGRERSAGRGGGTPGAEVDQPVASATGEHFFRSLVAELGRELAVEHVLVAWKTSDVAPELETVAFWSAGGRVPNVRCDLAGTPCELNLRGEACAFPAQVRRRFPDCEMLGELRAECYVGVPLVTPGGDTLGALAAVDSRPMNDLRSVQEALERFADRAASELARKRDEDALRAREARLSRQNEALVALARSRSAEHGDRQAFLREATEAAARTLDLDRSMVSLFGEGLHSLCVADLYVAADASHSSGDEIDTAGCPAYLRALEHERCLDVVDAETDERVNELWSSYFQPCGVRSTLDAPIRMGGRLIGVICNEHIGSPRRWHADERQFAASIADLISVGMEAVELQGARDQLQARNRELSALHRLAEISLRARSLGEALDAIVREVAALTGFPRVWIDLRDPERGRLTRASGLGSGGARALEAEGVLPATVSESGEPVVINVAAGGLGSDSVQGAEELTAYVGVPLAQEGKILGVLSLGRSDGEPVQTYLLPLLQSLASSIAGLVDRTRAREQADDLKERLRQAQKLEAIGTLAGGVAHDFNNLLTGILGYTWLLKQGAEPGGEVYRGASVIENAAERAAELTRQLLGFARQGKHQEVPVDLNELVREVTQLLGRTLDKAIAVHLSLSADRPRLTGDPGQLHQALLNLAINARDAMPSGGDLYLETEVLPDARVPRRAHPELGPGDHAVVAVRDSGQGIPAAELRRIFEPFFTTKEQGKGSGMGLAMVYGIAQAHRGAIEVESREGAGATFRMYFPVLSATRRSDAAAPQPPAPVESQPRRGSGLVLVVDDEELVRAMAQELLVGLGYHVITARNGLEAIDRFLDHRSEVDLVLLDLVMPRMGGRECLRALKRIDPSVRVLLSSGWQRDGLVQGALEDGALGFLSKPYQLVALSEAVARAMQA